jgi:outer membrane lipoprotein SlyB
MEKDQYECQNWAKQQTGFDPMTASPPPPADSQSETAKGVVKGGAVGALGGLAIGSLSGNAGAGAAIGATAGGVFGGMRSKNQQDRANQSNQQYYQQRLEEYNRACRACLIGRGYTVQ